MVVLLCFRSISVRRILKRSGPEPQKFEKNKGPNEHFWPKIFRHYLSIFCPKLGEDKKRSSLKFSPIFCPKLGEDQKNKRSSLKFSLILLGVGQNQRSSPTTCVLKASAQLTKVGVIPQFCIINYANYTILARGGVKAQGSRPRTQKKSEAKDSLSEDRPSRGQGQECSRPRTKDTGASALEKKRFSKTFLRRSPIHRRSQNF